MDKKKIFNFSDKSFEENLINLENIVAKMESSDISLDEAIKLYEEGLNLSIYLNNLLTKYEGKIKILEKNFEEGKVSTENNVENIDDKDSLKESDSFQNSNKTKKNNKVKDSEEQNIINEEKRNDTISNQDKQDDANQLF